jgi:uncharacterized membrane protein (UPF0127 family)
MTGGAMKPFTLSGYDVADTALKRARGIMLKKKIGRPILFIFPREGKAINAIHSFFCVARFDAIFLGGDRRIVDIIPRILPFHPFIVPRAPSKYLVEAEAGWAGKNGLEIGREVRFGPRKKS